MDSFKPHIKPKKPLLLRSATYDNDSPKHHGFGTFNSSKGSKSTAKSESHIQAQPDSPSSKKPARKQSSLSTTPPSEEPVLMDSQRGDASYGDNEDAGAEDIT